MSHELRTPIGGIIGLAECSVAASQRGGPELHPADHRFGSLASQDHRRHPRPRGSKQALELASIEFNCCRARHAPRHVRTGSGEQGLSFTVTTAADIAGDAQGDPEQLLQVLRNLVSNAIGTPITAASR